MGLMKLETTEFQDQALDKMALILGEKTRTKAMRKFLDLLAEGKIKLIIE